MSHRATAGILRALLVGFALTGGTAARAQEASADVEAIIAAGRHDGHGVSTYVVASREEQARVLETLGLEALSQALVFDEDGTPYDVVETSGGTVRFEISAYFGEGS